MTIFLGVRYVNVHLDHPNEVARLEPGRSTFINPLTIIRYATRVLSLILAALAANHAAIFFTMMIMTSTSVSAYAAPLLTPFDLTRMDPPLKI